VRQADALDKLAAVGANGGPFDRKGEIMEIRNGSQNPKISVFLGLFFADIFLF